MGHQGQTEEPRTNRVTRPGGGWTPSRGFWAGVAVAGIFSLIVVAAGAFASGSDPSSGDSQGRAPTAAAVDEGPARNVEAAREVPMDGRRPAGAVRDGEPAVSPSGEQPAAVSATSSAPAAVASSWSATPVFDTPAPAPALTAAAVALAGDTEARFGLDIALEGQDWGAGGGEQVANIRAVASAFEALPVTVTSSVVSGPRGTLTVLSNREGRTQDGWKPYGGAARSFYTNSDQGPSGYRAANEIVLSTGADAATVAHELIHGWTFRDIAPDEYVLALLGNEMRSFMRAAGWVQLGTDEEVRAAVRAPWETVNSLFAYSGPALAYTDQYGNPATLVADNPLEAIAQMGAIYYARPANMPRPAWTAAWAWFDASFG